jgi:hypothetical protein
MNEEDFYTEDHTCIHCDWQVNYYSEVKELASALWIKYNAGLEGDDRAPYWDTFIDDAIEIIAKDKSTVTICLKCYSEFE